MSHGQIVRVGRPESLAHGSSSDETPGSSAGTYVTQTGTEETGTEASSSVKRPCAKKTRYACTFNPESSKLHGPEFQGRVHLLSVRSALET